MIFVFEAFLRLSWRAQTWHAKISSLSLAINLRYLFTQTHVVGTAFLAFIQLVAGGHASGITGLREKKDDLDLCTFLVQRDTPSES